MSWHTGRLAAFDTETTGVFPQSDRIVTAAVSVVGGGQDPVSHAWLLDPGVEIPVAATAVHGITTARARAEGQTPATAIDEIVTVLAEQLGHGIPLIAFNARFDLTCLDREARRHGVRPLVDRVGPEGMIVVDPFVLDKQFDRFRKGKRTLTAVCAHYSVPLKDAHAANADALAAARVAWRLGQAFPELRDADLRTLHGQQIGWAAEQAASLEKYFLSQGRSEHIEREWPIVPERVVVEPAAAEAPPLAA